MTSRQSLAVLCVLLAATPVTLAAQVGTLAVLAPLTSMRGDCRTGVPNTALARMGVRQINVFLAEKGERRLSVATGAAGQVISFSAVASKRVNAKRTENEFATAIFAPDGSLRLGTRAFRVTAIPPRTTDDRERRLTPAEGAEALALAKVVAQRCPARK